MPERFENNDPIQDQLAAYLDGELSGEQREAFERRLGEDKELMQQVELQQRIDLSLLGMFAVPDSVPDFDYSAKPVSVAPAASDGRRSIGQSPWFWAAAACLVWALVFVFYPRTTKPQIQFVQRPVTEIYQECVDGGFRPYWDCNGQEERFAATFKLRQGVELALGDLPEGCRMAGLSYLPAVSRDTTAMLAYSNDKPVILFVDRKENGQVMAPTSDDSLHLHSKTVGELILFELTPDKEPRFLDAIKVR
ncbi:MAG: zf-HC2 domain-containing protein [Planctomycetota bacterium]